MTDTEKAPARTDAFLIYVRPTAEEANQEGLAITGKAIAFVLASSPEQALEVNQTPDSWAVLAHDCPTEDVLKMCAIATAGLLGTLLQQNQRLIFALQMAVGGGGSSIDPRKVRTHGQ